MEKIVIIPTYNEKENIEAIIAAVFNLQLGYHILVIDDGSPDIATSLKLVKGLYDLGYRRLVATPHVIGDFYRNNPAIINRELERLKNACDWDRQKSFDAGLHHRP